MRKIHKRALHGTAADVETFIRLKPELLDGLRQMERDKGYIEVLDLQPQWHTSYNEEAETFSYIIYAWFVFIGKHKAQRAEGYLDGRTIYKRVA